MTPEKISAMEYARFALTGWLVAALVFLVWFRNSLVRDQGANFGGVNLGSRNLRYQLLGFQDHPLSTALALTGQDLIRFLAVRRT
jgi:hypothetical protein